MEVIIYIQKIRHNISVIRDICFKAGIQTVWVTKGCHSYPDIVKLLREMNEETLGEVYLSNLEHIADTFQGQKMMIQPPAIHQAADAVRLADIILISGLEHAEALSKAAKALDKRQCVILMVDVGNLREGIMPENAVNTVKTMLSFSGINLVGIGTSVGCYGGYRAGVTDMQRFVEIAGRIETASGYKFEFLSAGSGTMLLDIIKAGKLPADINQIRIGAAFLVGEKPPTGEPIYPLYQDCFVFRGSILELYRKPSHPAGRTGSDAFGKHIVFDNIGERIKALLNFGMIDVDIYGLTPKTPGIRIIGGTSNYTICDVTECKVRLSVGSYIEFRMAYSAMARAMGSRYVCKTLCYASFLYTDSNISE